MATANIKRQRQRNFNSQEKDLLLTLVERYKSVIENKKTDGVTTQEKNQTWSVICQEFNSQSIFPRSQDSLKIFYKNLKKEVRKKAAEFKKHTYMTGGGPEPAPFSEEDLKVLSVVKEKNVFGMNNPLDSDGLNESDMENFDVLIGNDTPSTSKHKLNDKPYGDESFEKENNDMEKCDWKRYKPSHLQQEPSSVLKNNLVSTESKNDNIIEIVFEEEERAKPLKNNSPTGNNTAPTILAGPCGSGQSSSEKSTPTNTLKNVRSTSRRRPNTIKTLTSSALGEKYEILVDKKIELANFLKKEHELRMRAIELDIQLKQKQLNE